MSAEEMEEWRYYFSIEPTPENKIVHHIAQLTSVYLQSKGQKKAKLTDFVIDYDAKVEKVSPKELKKTLLEQIKGEL